MAILQVLWILALLLVISAETLSSGSLSYRLAQNSYENAKIDALVDAAVVRAVLGLMDARTDQAWSPDGALRNVSLWGHDAVISVRDEAGKIDINHTDRSLLLRLFQSAGLTPSNAETLAEKVVDWRTVHPPQHLGISTSNDGSTVGARHVRHGPFQSVDELRLVEGLTDETFKRIRPAITVYSGRQFIDLRLAPPDIMAVLSRPNADAESIKYNFTLSGRAFSIHIALNFGEKKITRLVVVRLNGDENTGYWILSDTNGYQTNMSGK